MKVLSPEERCLWNGCVVTDGLGRQAAPKIEREPILVFLGV